MKHILYKTGDADAPEVIRDGNGAVVLDLCRVCGKGEVELLEGSCTPKRGIQRSSQSGDAEYRAKRLMVAASILAGVVTPLTQGELITALTTADRLISANEAAALPFILPVDNVTPYTTKKQRQFEEFMARHFQGITLERTTGNAYKSDGVQLCWLAWRGPITDQPSAEELQQVRAERDALRKRVQQLTDTLIDTHERCGCGHPACYKCSSDRAVDDVLAVANAPAQRRVWRPLNHT